MDASRFDRFSRSLAAGCSRRGVLSLLTALPIAGAALAWRNEETVARRKKKKGKNKKQPPPSCLPASDAETCAGTCGTVTNNCGTAVDCGSCACTPHCPACQVCNEATRKCQPNAAHVDLACGDGQICQNNGTCACRGESCGICRRCDAASGRCEPNPAVPNRTVCAGNGAATSICCNGVCCDGCCGADGSCGVCRVFVTGAPYFNAVLGGLAGADASCQARAAGVNPPLPGTYKAWLSTGPGANQSPAGGRFRRARGTYTLIDGSTTVANGWADLTDGTLQHAIDMTETGEFTPSGYLAWSNTATNGFEVGGGDDCGEWTDSFAIFGGTGDIGRVDSRWTYNGGISCNYDEARLFCFQQD